MQTLSACVANIFDTRKVVRALKRPEVRPVLKSRIEHEIGSVAIMKFNFIDQALTNAEHEDLQIIVNG